MPSGNYYRTQAELFVRLAQASRDPQVAERYHQMARDQIGKAGKSATGPDDVQPGTGKDAGADRGS